MTTEKAAARAAKLAKARMHSAILNDRTDVLNHALEAAEKEFTGLRLGVEAYVSLYHDFDEEAGVTQYANLWFEKDGADWKFTVRTGIEEDEVRDHKTPLLKASKQLRLDAARKMDELLDALIEKSGRQIEEVDGAIESVAEVVHAIAPERANGGPLVMGSLGALHLRAQATSRTAEAAAQEAADHAQAAEAARIRKAAK